MRVKLDTKERKWVLSDVGSSAGNEMVQAKGRRRKEKRYRRSRTIVCERE